MELVFLFDVDNTLLDNDRAKEDLAQHVERIVGPERAQRFWALYEEVRRARDYVDLPGTLERFHEEVPDEPAYPQLCALVLDYPFERVLYPGAIEAIHHLKRLGTVAILSDGDPVYQPAKIARAGLADAVDRHVLIYDHKEQHLDEVQRRLPADRYVLIDDKPSILAAAKQRLGDHLTTILVRQGKYAREPTPAGAAPPDLAVDGIGDLRGLTAEQVLRPEGFPPITVAQMIEVDRLMVEEQGIALEQMMENAGRGLAAVAARLQGGTLARRKIVVLVGSGNNGGGGLVAARHLANAAANVAVALAPPLDEIGDVPTRQRRALVRMGVAGSGQTTPPSALPPLLEGADLVLDALIGYSLRGAPREPIASFIRIANAARVTTLALDLPSGLPGDTGVPFDPTIRADATVTLAWPKAGLLADAARAVVGDLYLADISVPAAVYGAVGVDPGEIFAGGPVVRVRPARRGWLPATMVGEAA